MNAKGTRAFQDDDRTWFDSTRDRLETFATEFDRHFERLLTPSDDVQPELAEAVRYSALAPGKRIRPYLAVRCCELVGGQRADAWPVATAVECVHAFSLIHDDLPAMDDDDLRRGQPASHKKFGEAMAILAGDALVVLAFQVLGEHVEDGRLVSALVEELARGAGWSGMIGGQTADVLGESREPSLELARYIHAHKTASLFETACRLGALTARGDRDQVAALGRYGHRLGRAFQIADDLLDETSTSRALGKDVAKDARAGKQTFPRCVGMEESVRAAEEAVRSSVAELDGYGPAATDLRQLAQYVVYRNY